VTIAPISGAALRRKLGGRGSRASASGGEASDAAAAAAAGKRRRGVGPAADDDDDKASTHAASSIDGRSRRSAGGFTGPVSLAGGAIQFNGGGGASSIASTVTGGLKGKSLLADAEVMRTRDLGVTDTRYAGSGSGGGPCTFITPLVAPPPHHSFLVRTHLGNVIRPGDAVLGYDLSSGVWNDADAETHAT
jgi:hypothetical protein